MRVAPRFAAVTAALALAVGAIIVPAEGFVPLDAAAAPMQYDPSGVLALSTGTTDVVRFDSNADGTPERTQSLAAASNCALSTNESLLGIDGFVGTSSGATDLASFASDSIGVAEKKSGTSCYQANATLERVVLRLNQTNVRGPLGPLVARSAYLDVELKQSARVLAIARNGQTEVARFELQSGATIGLPRLAGVPQERLFTCNNPADSGPDSGINDNCRWPISVPSWLGADDGVVFTDLELQAVNGSFSIEGGGDGAVPQASGIVPSVPALYTRATLFELAQPKMGDLDCGDSVTIQPNGTSPGVTVDRLATNASPETCQAVPYTLKNGTGFAQFLKPLDQQSTAQFVITLTWSVPASAPLPLPPTYADYETPQPGTEIKVGWCPDPIFSGDVLVGVNDPLNNPGVVDQDEVPGKQFTCIGSQRATVLGGGTPGLADDVVQVTEQLYVLGDIYLRKG